MAMAGMGQDAAAFAVAKVGTTLAFTAAQNGAMFTFTLDPPFLTNIGAGQSEIDFAASFNGSTIFSADAMLDNGSLTTSGAFSPGDFSVRTVGSQTTALLINDTFSVPFDILPSQVGQAIPFEFDQSFTAMAQNGGTAIVGDVPEPSSLLLLSTAVVVILVCCSSHVFMASISGWLSAWQV
jgi:hypothetical protein